MRVLVTGATGFVGRELVKRFPDVVVLSRRPERAREKLGKETTVFEWDPVQGLPPEDAFAGVEAVVNLLGEPVAEGRWTPGKKQQIVNSRVLGTAHLVQAMEKLSDRPRVLVNGSAIGIYGSRGGELLGEEAQPGNDFLADCCQKWEVEAEKASGLGVRVVRLRIGVVLGRSGGALQKMLLPFRLGLGGKLGSGAQWMSWIHIEDLVGLIELSIRNEEVLGAVNAVAPFPVTNIEFTRELGKVLRRPTLMAVPKFGLKALLGEMSSVLLDSQRVLPRAAESFRYEYRYPKLEAALKDLLQ